MDPLEKYGGMIKSDPRSFSRIPGRCKTRELCELAVECEPYNILHVDSYFEELYVKALSQKPVLFTRIPAEMRSKEGVLCAAAAAVEESGYLEACYSVGKHLTTEQLEYLASRGFTKVLAGYLWSTNVQAWKLNGLDRMPVEAAAVVMLDELESYLDSFGSAFTRECRNGSFLSRALKDYFSLASVSGNIARGVSLLVSHPECREFCRCERTLAEFEETHRELVESWHCM